MEAIYSVLETIIPFEFINYTFMKNALLAIVLVTPVFAILGTMIVNNKMAFFSDALGHSALTGIAIGMVLGITNINIGMILFAIVFALLLNYVKNKSIDADMKYCICNTSGLGGYNSSLIFARV